MLPAESIPTAGLRREVLPNGVTLLVQRRRAAPAASLATFVRAGFLDEPDQLVGISHVLEHMLFKGTPTVAPGELAQLTKALGGSLNAYTSYDRTVYYASVPARHIAELIRLQADQVQNPLLDADELRRELGVIIQEANRKLDSPGAVAGETLHELLFDNHRIRRWRIGVESMLQTFTHDDVAGYHASRYVPSRTIVSLVGDVDEDAALDALRARWGGWSRQATDIPAGPVEHAPAELRARRLSGDVVLAEVVMGWRGPGVLDPDGPSLDVASAVLSTGRGSRFSQRLREPGLVNSIGMGWYGVLDAGVVSLGIELDPARLPAVLSVIEQSIAELSVSAPSPAEFDRAVTMLRARVGRRLERYESRALALGGAELLGDVTDLDREESDLLAVTPEMVSDVLRRTLLPGTVSAVAYLPRSSEAEFNVELLRSAAAQPSAEGSASGVTGVPLRNTAPRRDPRDAVPYSQKGNSAVRHLKLDGLDILTARFGETGQATMSVYRMRNAAESAANAGLAALAIRSMMRGTIRLDATELAVAMESLGGGLSPSLGSDVLGFGTTVLSEFVRDAGELLADVFYRPRFDPASVEIERALLRDDARAVADDMVRFPVQLMLGVAFNDAGYGSPSLGTVESLATLDAASVRHWHGEMLAGGRTTIVAVGDADPERMAGEIAAAFEGHASAAALAETAGGGRAPVASLAPAAGTRGAARDRKQSALAMLFPGPSRHDPERFAAETWGAIAAGLGGRMFESLRSKRSLAYTVIASSWQRRRSGGLLTYIATDPSRLEEAREAMLEELATFRREPPSAIELSRATAMLAGEAEMSRQTAGSYAGEIADAWLLGAGLDELRDPAAPYRAVTAEAVHAVTARSLDPALRAEGVVVATATE